MGLVAKAGGVILGVAAVFYIVLFLVALPTMANAPRSSAIHATSANIYSTLYVPVRDALPYDNFVRQLIVDYEHYWCGGVTGCVLR